MKDRLKFIHLRNILTFRAAYNETPETCALLRYQLIFFSVTDNVILLFIKRIWNFIICEKH